MKQEIDADIIVIGGGLAGTFSAIAAKRTNPEADVWLIERFGYLGGMATAGYVFPFMKYWGKNNGNDSKYKRLSGGLFQNMLERMHKKGYTEKKARRKNFYTRFDPMMMRCILDDMVLEAGVKILFNAIVNKVNYDNKPTEKLKKIQSIKIQTKAGEIEGNSKLFVDATGDADIIYHAKAEFEMGREKDGLVQPATMNFRIGNISILGAGRRHIGKKVREYKQNGNELTPRDDCLKFIGKSRKEMHFNQTRVAGYDFTDPFEMTEAEIEGRKQVDNFVQFLRNEIRGYKHSSVMNIASTLGVRESRRIIGEYQIKAEDLINGKLFDDRIALGNYSIDIHDPKGSAETEIVHFPKGHYYSIPYRATIPKGLKNVLVAGRPISSSHRAHSAIRIMPICSAIGHGVGVAMGLLTKEENKEKNNVRNIDIEQLQQTLRKQKAKID